MSIFYIKKSFVVILFICFGSFSYAQDEFSLFNESNLSLNKKFSTLYKTNFSIKGRNYIYNDSQIHFKQRQIEFGHFSTFSLSSKHSLSFGVMFRNRSWFEDSKNEFRLTEQFNFKTPLNELRFGHRVRAEQRFVKNKTTHRFRYRLAIDFPLNGTKLDVGEAYLVTSTEFLWSITKLNRPSLDNRWTSQLGWYYSKAIKLQLGFEYRFENINQSTKHTGFILTSAILNI